MYKIRNVQKKGRVLGPGLIQRENVEKAWVNKQLYVN